MQDTAHLFYGAPVFDGKLWHENAALEVENGLVKTLLPGRKAPAGGATRLEKGFLAPGFVDLQANGGGGALFNDDPGLETIRTICAAHACFGTTALLPTFITDTPQKQEKAIQAISMACAERVPGCLGLHLEGPHIAEARHGAHETSLIRPMRGGDADKLVKAAKALPVLLVTLAPEAATASQVRKLADAGITISLGHSEAGYAEAKAHMQAGARLVTHLFNAMAPLHHRKAGLALAALDLGPLSAGLIGDGHHVEKHMIGLALRAKKGPGHIFLVSDAMAIAGTQQNHFKLNNRPVFRKKGRLSLEDGTLAGSAAMLIDALRYVRQEAGIPLEEALKMTSLYPALAIGQAERHGHLQKGAYANFVHLSEDLQLLGTWIRGQKVG